MKYTLQPIIIPTKYTQKNFIKIGRPVSEEFDHYHRDMRFFIYKGTFTPSEHCLRTFENVCKRFQTFKNILKHAGRDSVHTA